MKKIGLHHCILMLLAVIFGVSLALCLLNRTQRRLFSFPVIGSDQLAVEVRYLPRHPAQGDVSLYVDELLLGPQTQRARPLFSMGTKNEFCFLRGKTLYVGISEPALLEIPEAAKIKDGVALFRKNIMQNFRNVAAIAFFIDGKYVE